MSSAIYCYSGTYRYDHIDSAGVHRIVQDSEESDINTVAKTPNGSLSENQSFKVGTACRVGRHGSYNQIDKPVR